VVCRTPIVYIQTAVRFVQHFCRGRQCVKQCVQHGHSGVATGWTGVDMPIPLLLKDAPEIDTNSTSFCRGRGSGVAPPPDPRYRLALRARHVCPPHIRGVARSKYVGGPIWRARAYNGGLGADPTGPTPLPLPPVKLVGFVSISRATSSKSGVDMSTPVHPVATPLDTQTHRRPRCIGYNRPHLSYI